MSELSSRFPEPLREGFIRKRLNPGRFLYLDCDFTVPPKEKYLLLLDLSGSSLIFLVNSRIHQYILSRPQLLSCQLKLEDSTYDFLDHDSYLDCSNAIDEFTEEEIISQLMNDTARLLGELSESDAIKLRSIVNSTKTISPKNKSIILANF